MTRTFIGMENICKDGYIVFADGVRYAYHYNTILGYVKDEILYLNDVFNNKGRQFSRSDGKIIKALCWQDSNIKQKGISFVSDIYQIKWVNI